MAETIIQLLFWVLIGLWFLNVRFRYQDVIIGICALLIGLLMLVAIL